MVAGKSPDWLPPGWNVQVRVSNGRKVKYYCNMETGQKFQSKKDIIRYVKMGDVCCDTPQPMSKHNKRRLKKKPMPIVVKTNETPEWLPHGWIMELKTRKGGSRIGDNYKCYIDPATGFKFYSKPDVFRYLKTVKRNSGTAKQKKIGVVSARNLKFERATGGKSSSKPDASQNHKTKSCTSKQKKIGIGKHSMNNVVVERVSADGLPAGWIKEIKAKKSVNGIRKDPYYTDPVSGYVFRSKRDALRYLETGDIGSCAIKPKKRDTNEVGLISDDISSPSAIDAKKTGHHTTRKRLFAGEKSKDDTHIISGKESCGKESCDTGTLAAPESKKRKVNSVSADATFTSTPTAEILGEYCSLDRANEKCAEPKESSDQRIKGSKGEQEMAVLAENGSVSTPETNVLPEQKLPQNEMKKHSKRKTQIDLSRSKNKKALNLPGRSSKRLAGVKPEILADFWLSERALRAAARKSSETEPNPSLGLALDATAHSVPHQREAEPEMEIANHACAGKGALSDVEQLNQNEKPLEGQAVPEEQPRVQENEKQDDEKPVSQDSQLFCPIADPCLEFAEPLEGQAVPEEHPRVQETEKRDDEKPESVPEEHPRVQETKKQDDEKPESQDSQLFCPFGDSWSDPCLEFAFKTLTGAIPVEDNLVHGYFQQQLDTSHTQSDGCLALPEFGSGLFQNDVSSHFDAPEKHAPMQQLPVNPTFLPPGDVNLPSCSSLGPQQPSLEAGKEEYQTKVN